MNTDLERTIAERHKRIADAITVITARSEQMENTWPGAGSLGHAAVTLEQIAQFLLPGDTDQEGQELTDTIAQAARRCIGLCADCAEQPEADGLSVRLVAPMDCEVCEGEGYER